MRKFMINVNGKSYEVEVEEMQGDTPISQPTYSAPAPAAAPTPAPQAAPAPKAAPSGSTGATKITAPMPGTILEVSVNVGDTIAEGQTVVILEAMKMENEIVAPKAGTVTSINTTKSSSVNSGDLLITMD